MLNRVKALLRTCISLLILIAVISAAACGQPPAGSFSVILCIGDGMGAEQIQAASYYTAGKDGSLSFQDFPVAADITTFSAGNPITDSAASATAMATGTKVNNGVISRNLPGDGSDIETIAELFQREGKSLGLVTTAYMTHATPAAFAAHADSRGNYDKIAEDYFNRIRPNILFGGGGNGIDRALAESAGYTVVTNRQELNNLEQNGNVYISGQFGLSHLPYELDGLGDLPRLHEMALTALDLLSLDPEGFFLLVEGGRIDHACHGNDISRAVQETAEFSYTVQAIETWMGDRDDVLLIVTADHETGGLSVENRGEGVMPGASWTTTGHTGVIVPLYATGYKAEVFSAAADNTDVCDLIVSLME